MGQKRRRPAVMWGVLDLAMQMHYLFGPLQPRSTGRDEMTALAQDYSKLTDRYQTTVPSTVRKQLNLSKGDQLRYCTEPNGRVYIEPVRAGENDPAIGAFLDFIEADIKAHPERLRSYDGALHHRLQALIGDIHVDLDEPLVSEDE